MRRLLLWLALVAVSGAVLAMVMVVPLVEVKEFAAAGALLCLATVTQIALYLPPTPTGAMA